MRISRFTLLLTLAILMVIGCALIPRIDVADRPRPRQGKTLSVWYSWHGASAKVIEQNVTSRIEGLVSAVRGVESVKSESYFGSGRVTIELKKNADVSATKFEIASLLRQIRKQLPEGVSYPELSGGEVVNENQRKETTQVLLSYRVNSNLSDEQLKEYIERQVEPSLRQIDEVKRVEVTGGRSKYIVITYDPFILSSYGLSAGDIENGIKSFLGKSDVVGELQPSGQKEKRTLYLTTEKFGKPLEEMPIGAVDGKTVYLGDLATYEYKDRLPGSYYRVNGLNTIYLNIHVDADVNKITLSRTLRKKIAEIEKGLRGGVYLTLTHDGAEEKESELNKLIWRSTLSLFILLLFVWLVRRDWRYLLIMMLTLAANLALAVICYYVFDIRLHIYSLAGITVSLGMVIDAAVVMVDHYSYSRNYGAFHGILGAMLTTIGSLIIIVWLPEFLKNDLYDFSWMVIINLVVALLVAALFAPALVSRMNYTSLQAGKPRHLQFVRGWTMFYAKYVRICQHRIWRWPLLLMVAGLFAGSLYLFIDTLDSNTYRPEPEEMQLHIRGQMPLGGTAQQLNEKVEKVEAFLSQFKEIKRYETHVDNWGASITVEFKPDALHTGFPYLLENKVIGRLITIGGADWSTHGVSERGFSNSLNLQYRANSIEIAGYDYDRLYRFAEDMCRKLKTNNRVTDIAIETPGHEHQEDELYMEYDKQRLTLDSVRVTEIYGTLSSLLSEHHLGSQYHAGQKMDIVLSPRQHDDFDLWQLENSYIKVANRDVKVSDLMSIGRREAKNCIPRENQEYILRVAFNVLGSYTYTSKYIKQVTEEFNAKFPVGFRCLNRTYGWYEDGGTQYWLIGLVAVIIFFICAILFESLYQALVIILLIPVSLVGTFLTYHFSGTEFGTGGFAAMVLLCGLTVNAGIYLMNEYNHNGKRFIKAYNHKIIPILLTVASTMVGLIPFLMDGAKERFWFSFSIGSISGLIFSLVALVFVMPMLMRKRNNETFQS